MMQDYNFKELETKWQKKWEEDNLYQVDITKSQNKFYCLVMFPYPSGDRLHMGHWYNFGPTDTFARFKRMQGYNVLEPMGYDAFGLPAENYAIKVGVHPTDSTTRNIKEFRKQFKAIGAMYDWSKEINTSSPEYYRWTQWLFLQLYHKGLAYRKKSPVNWCPSCKTILANEQVLLGVCERCHSEVTRKDIEGWFFKITNYAERLLKGHDLLDWPEKTKLMQKNWIGRSEGTQIKFKIDGQAESVEIFTTRPDTLFGVTYMTFAPEHTLVEKITTPAQRQIVQDYIEKARKISDIDRTSTEREKTGVFTGAFAINPVNNEKVPIWISDYVLLSYGTGAVMAVPAHDQRDFEFAQKYNLPIREVISVGGKSRTEPMIQAYEEPGIMINSEQFSGMSSEEGKKQVTEWLVQKQLGYGTVNYRLRDWGISRQRYWGAPIPIIYCPQCGEVPVPEDQLPVLLPYEVKFTGAGESPLTTNPDFVNTTCPKCGHTATREVDTMDTFVCSSWYFLRYIDPHNSKAAFDKEKVNQWLPVDQYVGGAEHANMHLLYARFFTKVLYDLGLINFEEPFNRLIHQGIITYQGEKMSKSRGNVVNPDKYIEHYGSDVLRLYMMFMGSYTDGGDWSDEGIHGVNRFINRFWRLIQQINELEKPANNAEPVPELERTRHYSTKWATIDLERLHFNTVISRIMELVNATYQYLQNVNLSDYNIKELATCKETLIKLLAPFAPHTCEELWQMAGYPGSVFDSSWPTYDESRLKQDEVTVVIQINGKLRAQITVPLDSTQEFIFNNARENEKIQKYLENVKIIKQIFVKNKLLNIVVK
jgi:leucyl-tRNA synthetase